jgi:hypothetical protein
LESTKSINRTELLLRYDECINGLGAIPYTNKLTTIKISEIQK